MFPRLSLTPPSTHKTNTHKTHAHQQNKPNKGPEDEAAIKALYKKFGAWHGISSLNNLGVLASTVAYAWIVASKLAAPL